MKKILLGFGISLFLIGCSVENKNNLSKEIVGNVYILENKLNGSEIDLSFNDGKINGSSGVNRYFGDYKINGNELLIEHIGSTKMMGPPEIMNQEQEYLKNLANAKEVILTKRGIEITTNSGVKINFEKKN